MEEFIDIERVLSSIEIEKWNQKLSVYTIFKPEILKNKNDQSVFVQTELNVWSYMTLENFEQNYKNKPPQYIIIKKISDYLYKKEKKEILDDLDIKFVNQEFWRFKKLKLYGYHTYGGYYSFFCPDLTEIIHLLHDAHQNKKFDFEDVKRIYVTSEPYKTFENKDNYHGEYLDYLEDKYKAVTTCYLYLDKGKEKMKTSKHLLKKNFMGIKKH